MLNLLLTIIIFIAFSALPLRDGNRNNGNRGNREHSEGEIPMVVIDTPVYSMPSRTSSYIGILKAGTFVWNNKGLVESGGSLMPGGFRSKPETWLQLASGGYALVTDWTNRVYITGV